MRKLHVVIMSIIILIVLIISGVFIFKNWEVESDDWLYNYSGDDFFEEMIFNDVPKTHPKSDYILYLTQREIMFASGDGNFYPNQKVTMGEFVEILLRASMPRLDFDSLTSGDFVKKFEETKVLKEGEINLDNLDSKVTNYQVAVLLAKVDMKIRNNRQKIATLNFTDLKDLDEVSQTLIGHSVESGFFKLKDSKNFYPYKTLTRAEIAEIIYLFVNS